MGGQIEAPCGLGADTGRGNRAATAAGTPNVLETRRQRYGNTTGFVVSFGTDDPFNIWVKGRVLWALERLSEAGQQGCTPIDTPGPRWSAYVHDLRQMGVAIETIHEPHGGPFKGTHARYVLQSKVTRIDGADRGAQ